MRQMELLKHPLLVFPMSQVHFVGRYLSVESAHAHEEAPHAKDFVARTRAAVVGVRVETFAEMTGTECRRG